MKMKTTVRNSEIPRHEDVPRQLANLARIYEVGPDAGCLDPTELARLEQAFRAWAQAPQREDVRNSRKRILLIFLLIRYTAARLNEVLDLDVRNHVDMEKGIIRYGQTKPSDASTFREVQISSDLKAELQSILGQEPFSNQLDQVLRVDPGHVRRKFYERCSACGFPQELGSPNAIRKARALELMQNNVPLPVVQRILGHSTPNLTAALVSFSEEEVRQVARHFMEKESQRRTSARNTFFGKIRNLKIGDVQCSIELVTLGGDVLTTVITNNSLKRLGLRIGSLVTAEVKAPWVIVLKSETEPLCTAENVFQGTIVQVIRGKLVTEITVRIHDGTELCSVVTEASRRKLDIRKNDKVWILFNSFAVVLHVD
jgi:molybdate transport system regulatory protein